MVRPGGLFLRLHRSQSCREDGQLHLEQREHLHRLGHCRRHAHGDQGRHRHHQRHRRRRFQPAFWRRRCRRGRPHCRLRPGHMHHRGYYWRGRQGQLLPQRPGHRHNAQLQRHGTRRHRHRPGELHRHHQLQRAHLDSRAHGEGELQERAVLGHCHPPTHRRGPRQAGRPTSGGRG